MFFDHNEISLNIHNRMSSGHFPNIWKLNKILLNNSQIKRGKHKEIRKYFKLNKTENTIDPNSWNAA